MMRKGMWSVATFGAMMFMFVSASQSVAQPAASPPLTLRVEAVDGARAVLTDRNTSVQTTVEVGDVIQDWTVAAISSGGVEIEREDSEQGQRIRALLPVGLVGLSIPSP